MQLMLNQVLNVLQAFHVGHVSQSNNRRHCCVNYCYLVNNSAVQFACRNTMVKEVALPRSSAKNLFWSCASREVRPIIYKFYGKSVRLHVKYSPGYLIGCQTIDKTILFIIFEEPLFMSITAISSFFFLILNKKNVNDRISFNLCCGNGSCGRFTAGYFRLRGGWTVSGFAHVRNSSGTFEKFMSDKKMSRPIVLL